MSSQPTRCPPLASLEAIASGEVPAPDVLEHLSRCASCAEFMEAASFSRRFAEVMQSSDADADPGQPSLFGYQILGEIARGGQGVVYRARQQSSGQLVAIKVLHGTNTSAGPTREARHRFLREIELIASLRAPGIARVLDSLKLLDGRDALVMDLVEGQTLDRWRATDPIPPERTKIEILAAIAETVHHAHQRGVTHRDLKPSNIIVDSQGRPWIIDFGVARSTLTPSLADRVTRTGQFTGTLAYAAPEQVAPVSPAPDVRTDVYAIGMIGFELLTDSLPYAVDGSLESTVRNILEVSPRARPPQGVRTDVWHVLSKACAKSPSRRYQSAFDLAKDLRSAATGGAVEARGDSRLYLLRKTLERHRFAASLLAIGVSVIVAIAILLAVGNTRLDRALRESRLSEIKAHLAAGERESASQLIRQELGVIGVSRHELPRTLWFGDLHSRKLLWRAMQMQAEAACLRTIRLERESPSRLVLGSDNRLGLINSHGTVRVFDTQSSAIVFEHDVTLAPDSRFAWLTSDLARVVDWSGTALSVIDIPTGRQIAHTVLPHRFEGIPLAWVANEAFVAVSQDGLLLVLDLRDLSSVVELMGALPDQLAWCDGPDKTVSYINDEASLVTQPVALDPQMPVQSERLFEEPVQGRRPQIVLSSDRSFALVTHRDGIEVLRHREQKYVPERSLTTGYLSRIILSPDGLLLGASAFGDAKFRLWDTRGFEELPPLSGHSGTVLSAAFADDGERIATVDSSGVFRLWGTANSVWREALGKPTNMAHQIAIEPINQTVLYADSGGFVNAEQQESLTPFGLADRLPGVRVAVHESGRWLATATLAGTVSIMPLLDGRTDPAIGWRLEFGDDLSAIRFMPGSEGTAPALAIATAGGQVVLVDVDDGEELWRAVLPPPVGLSDLRWTRDGRSLLVSTRSGRLLVLNAATGEVSRRLAPSSAQIRDIECSSDSRFAYAVGDEGRILCIDLTSGSVTRSERLSEHSLFAITMDTRRGVLYAGTRDGLVLVIDAPTLVELATIPTGGAVLDLATVPGSDALVVSCVDRPVERWNFGALATTLSAGLEPTDP